MPNYRRNRVPGGTFFFTVNLFERRSDLLVAEIDPLRAADAGETAVSYRCLGSLPDHMHAIWTLSEDDSDYSGRWGEIKTAYSKSLAPTETRSRQMLKRDERGIWQPRYWEHAIRDDRDYAANMDYVHFNPVKHGYAALPGAWSYSSFNHAVTMGLYPADWQATGAEPSVTGERR